ncbi:hypothetical protein GEMRC1_008434 [Eukaryota sp. GEM-RC1]
MSARHRSNSDTARHSDFSQNISNAHQTLSHLHSLLHKHQTTTADLRQKLLSTSQPLKDISTDSLEENLGQLSHLLRKPSPSFHPATTTRLVSPLSSLNLNSPPSSPNSHEPSLSPVFAESPSRQNHVSTVFDSFPGTAVFPSVEPSHEQLQSMYIQLEAENNMLKRQISLSQTNQSESNDQQSKILKATLNELSTLMERINFLEQQLKTQGVKKPITWS